MNLNCVLTQQNWHGWTLLSAVDHWMAWPSWNPCIWGRQNTPSSAKCIHCSEISLSNTYTAAFPWDAVLGSPRPQGHNSNKTEIEPLRDWDLHGRRAPTSVHTEAVPNLEEVFYGDLDSYILGHYSKNRLAHNLRLTRKPSVYYSLGLLVQRQLCLRASSATGGPGSPTSAVRALLLPRFLHCIWQSHGSSRSHLGRWLRSVPSSLQPLTLSPESARALLGGTWSQHAGTSQSPHTCCSTSWVILGGMWGAGERRQIFYYCWEWLVWRLAASLPQAALWFCRMRLSYTARNSFQVVTLQCDTSSCDTSMQQWFLCAQDAMGSSPPHRHGIGSWGRKALSSRINWVDR